MNPKKSGKSTGATVSGPGVDSRYPDGPAVALSAAISHATAHGAACTFYVRDEHGETFGRVERDDRGILRVYGPLYLAAERDQMRKEAPTFTPGA